MRLTDRARTLVVPAAIVVASVTTLAGCRTTSDPGRSAADLWSLETSDALRQACKFDYYGEDRAALADSIKNLGRCVEDQTIAKRWHLLVENRVRQNWPRDFAEGDDKNTACLERLTTGLVVRYGQDMTTRCRAFPDVAQARQLISDSVSEMQSPDCSDLTAMDPDGCFVRQACPLDANGMNTGNRATSRFCHPGIQRIHKVKDPSNTNLAWNNPFVIEMTGNQSSARITFGMPNCHGTAQAAAGDLLADLRLQKVEFARTSDESVCGPAARQFLADNSDKPVSAMDLRPGGILINMKHSDCAPTDCGTAKLWVETCHAADSADSANMAPPRPFDAGVFVDDMCVECWGKMLADHGLREDPDHAIRPGCILTTSDHSVFMVQRSAGWCFTYEATSPYGPPQLRANPCAWLEQKFSHHYCP